MSFNNMMYCFSIIVVLSTKLSRLEDKPKQLLSEMNNETSILGDILIYLNEPLLLEKKEIIAFRSKLQSLLTAFANQYIE
jgi:hypothetical protein